ncbi:MAG: DUF4136 domain-containing protein [Cyclobacteriaceae bacterium]
MRIHGAVLIIFLVQSCAPIDYIVESDYSYNGSFTRYRSFDFVNNIGFTGTENEKVIVERSLSSTLTSWGYNQSDRRPDLIVFYSIYYDDLNFRGFRQQEFKEWLLSNYSNREIVFKKDTLPDGGLIEEFEDDQLVPGKDKYNPITYSLREGTLLISLYDRRKRRMVWQGYASGVFSQNQERNERTMRSAVIRILDEYKLLAFGAS